MRFSFSFSKLFKFLFLFILFTLIFYNAYRILHYLLGILTNSSRIFMIFYTFAAIFYLLFTLILFFYIFEVIYFQFKTVFILFFVINVFVFTAITMFFYFGQDICQDIVADVENQPSGTDKAIVLIAFLIFFSFFFIRLNTYKWNMWDVIQYLSLIVLIFYTPSSQYYLKVAYLGIYLFFLSTRYNFKIECTDNNKNYAVIMGFLTIFAIIMGQIKNQQIQGEYLLYLFALFGAIYTQSPYYHKIEK
jgi:hypothetical protein